MSDAPPTPPAVPLLCVHHLAVETDDVDRSIQFYRDVLGFAVVPRPRFDFKGAWLENYGVQIHVIGGRPGQRRDSQINTRGNHVAFKTSDIEQAESVLQQHGVPYHRQVNAGGATQIFLQDPDGNHIELGVYHRPFIPETPQS